MTPLNTLLGGRAVARHSGSCLHTAPVHLVKSIARQLLNATTTTTTCYQGCNRKQWHGHVCAKPTGTLIDASHDHTADCTHAPVWMPAGQLRSSSDHSHAPLTSPPADLAIRLHSHHQVLTAVYYFTGNTSPALVTPWCALVNAAF